MVVRQFQVYLLQPSFRADYLQSGSYFWQNWRHHWLLLDKTRFP